MYIQYICSLLIGQMFSYAAYDEPGRSDDRYVANSTANPGVLRLPQQQLPKFCHQYVTVSLVNPSIIGE